MTRPLFTLLWLAFGIACTLLGAILTLRQRGMAAKEEGR